MRRDIIRGLMLSSSRNASAVFQMQKLTLVALIGIALYGILCWYLLDRKLNLE